MKTSHSPAAPAPSATRARAHVFLAILGIIAAIACGLILLQDAPTLPHITTSKLNITSISKFTTLVQTAL